MRRLLDGSHAIKEDLARVEADLQRKPLSTVEKARAFAALGKLIPARDKATRFSDGSLLGSWYGAQRRKLKKGRLEPEIRRILEGSQTIKEDLARYEVGLGTKN